MLCGHVVPRRKVDPQAGVSEYIGAFTAWLAAEDSIDLNNLRATMARSVTKGSTPSTNVMVQYSNLFRLLFLAARSGRINWVLVDIALVKLDAKDKLNFNGETRMSLPVGLLRCS